MQLDERRVDTAELLRDVLASPGFAQKLVSGSEGPDREDVLAAVERDPAMIRAFFSSFSVPNADDDRVVAMVARAYRDAADRGVSPCDELLSSLSLRQLQLLATALGDTVSSRAPFVACMLERLQGGDDDATVRLDSLLAYAATLPPAFNSLRLALAYQRVSGAAQSRERVLWHSVGAYAVLRCGDWVAASHTVHVVLDS
jgi:hypothetical protein